MDLADFDFELPEELIALRPAQPRRAARLMVADGEETHHQGIADLPGWLRPGDALVLNDTAVIPARLFGVRRRNTSDGGGEARIDATLIRRTGPGTWRALARPAKRLAQGDILELSGLKARVEARDGGMVDLSFDRSGADLDAAIATAGTMPLPPYIARRRAADARDREDYQTVFAARPGAVAAPTASLHFDDRLLTEIEAKDVRLVRVTLHVGAGTFLPVTAANADDHEMHAEWGEVTPEAAAALNDTRAAGGRLIAAGTTALRLLESAADSRGTLHPFLGETDIFIRPGHRFRATDGLLTNFHLPRSTLFMLVSALMGRERMQTLYAEAIAERYRFYSYGDGSLLLPARSERRGTDTG